MSLPSKIQSHRDRDLCYNYDERFHLDHWFKCQFHIFIIEPNDPEQIEKAIVFQLEVIDPFINTLESDSLVATRPK